MKQKYNEKRINKILKQKGKMSSDNDIVLTHNLFALYISGGFEDDD